MLACLSYYFGDHIIFVEDKVFRKLERIFCELFWHDKGIFRCVEAFDDLDPARVEINQIIAATGFDDIFSIASNQNVVACLTNELIISTATFEFVVE